MPEERPAAGVDLDLAIDEHLDPFAILSAVRGPDGAITDLRPDFVNRAVCDFLGIPKDELYGRGIVADHDPPLIDEETFARYAHVIETGEPLFRDEVDLVTWFGGQARRICVDLRVVRYGDGIVLGFRDSTERHEVRRRGELMRRLYATLSSVNEAIVAATDRETLYRAICEAAVEHAGIALAWIGVPDPAIGDVLVAESSGDAAGYLDDVVISIRDEPSGQGPTGRALREGRHMITPDMEADPALSPWRERATHYGLRSSAVFPLRCSGEVVAVISLYAHVPRFFDDEEVRLLDQLAADVSFALDAFDHEERRRAAERELTRTAALLADGEEVAGFGSWDWEADGDRITWSNGLCRLLGLAPEERAGWAPLERRFGRKTVELLRADDGPIGAAIATSAGEPVELTFGGPGADRVLQIAARPIRDADGELVRLVGTAQDVTARTRSDRELRAARDVLAEAEARASKLAEQRRLLVTEALNAEDRERTRLSETIHDDTLQVLLAAQQELTAAARGDAESLARAQDHVKYAQTRLREIVADLSPVVYEFSTLAEAIRNVARRQLGGDGVRVDLLLDEEAVTPHARLVIRAAGELLSNVAKHARASTVRVRLRRARGDVELLVIDDGVGCSPDLTAAVQGGHIGLASLTSRASAVGGDLTIDGTPGGGTKATLRVPAA